MTIQRALDIVDEMKPNTMTRELKIHFLSEIEQKIYEEILMKHEHTREEAEVPSYDVGSDPGTVLRVPDMYARVYTYWIICQIDEQNRETNEYNNDRMRFENAFEEFSDYWTRTRMPLTVRRHFRL